MARPYRKYTDEQIIEYSKEVRSMAQLFVKLGIKPVGGNYSNMKRRLQQLKVNTDHWTGQAWSKNQQLKDWSQYTCIEKLKPHLIRERGYKCETCLNHKWIDSPIPLEVHHKNGDRTNNEYNNLQLVCPNCHALTENYRGRKMA